MISRLIILFTICASLVACSKSSPTNTGCSFTESTLVAPASEIAALQNWISTNRPAAIAHSSGIFYEVLNPGTGTVTAAVCNTVRVKYAGYFLTGAKFDESVTGVSFLLGQLIVGWQKGIPLIKKGGIINLYIPPSLAYGAQASGSIPANSYLMFNVELMDVQ